MTLKEKLAGYSAAAAALLASDAAKAQIVYTDITPDVIVGSGGLGTYDLDINNDGVNDFRVQTYGLGFSPDIELLPLASNQVLTSISALTGNGYHFGWPTPLNNGDTISANRQYWFVGNANGNVNGNPVYHNYGGGWYIINGGYSTGPWVGQTNKFIGLKFFVSGQAHYGWLRLDAFGGFGGGSVTLKDYAYNTIANAPITAGDTTAATPAASNVQLADVANNGNASDMQYSFDKASVETGIAEYRLMVVKAASAANFTLDSANAATQYTTILPTGSNLSGILPSTALDTDGDPIVNGVAYNAFVLAFSSNANPNSLSSISNTLTLTAIAQPATNVQTADVGDNINGSDLQVSFNFAADESSLSEYRIMVVKDANAAAFNLASANAVLPANYTVVMPNGANQTTVLGSAALDVDGDPITNNVAYRVFVLSVANGVNATTNALSVPSNTNMLTTAAPVANNIVLSDIGDANNATDLQVAFDRAPNENLVSSYRIFVIKSSSVAFFTLNSANFAIAGTYLQVAPNGQNQVVVIPQNITDSQGDPIVNGVAYQVIVQTVGNSAFTSGNALSAPSSAITLATTPQTISGLTATDADDNADASDMLIEFTRAANEALVSAYRIMIVPASQASSFSLADANIVPATNYISRLPNGNNFSFRLPVGTKTITGVDVAQNVPYRVFVLTVGDGSIVTVNTLSAPSAEVTLTAAAPAVSNVNATDAADNNNGTDLQVNFDAPTSENLIAEYRLITVKQSSAAAFTLADANNLGQLFYKVQAKNGSANYSTFFGAASIDSDGDLIKNNQPYQVFVLSIADGALATQNTLSAPSNSVTLQGSAGINELKAGSDFILNGSQFIWLNAQSVNATLYSISGQKLQDFKCSQGQIVDFNNYKAGVYFLQTETGEVAKIQLNGAGN